MCQQCNALILTWSLSPLSFSSPSTCEPLLESSLDSSTFSSASLSRPLQITGRDPRTLNHFCKEDVTIFCDECLLIVLFTKLANPLSTSLYLTRTSLQTVPQLHLHKVIAIKFVYLLMYFRYWYELEEMHGTPRFWITTPIRPRISNLPIMRVSCQKIWSNIIGSSWIALHTSQPCSKLYEQSVYFTLQLSVPLLNLLFHSG